MATLSRRSGVWRSPSGVQPLWLECLIVIVVAVSAIPHICTRITSHSVVDLEAEHITCSSAQSSHEIRRKTTEQVWFGKGTYRALDPMGRSER
jgi:hypothetical protein